MSFFVNLTNLSQNLFLLKSKEVIDFECFKMELDYCINFILKAEFYLKKIKV